MEELIEQLSIMADDELMDDSFGNAYTFGWCALFSDYSAILVEKLDNITVEVFDNYSELMIAWQRLENGWITYAEIYGAE